MKYDAAVETVFAMYTDEEFIDRRLRGTGGTDVEATVTWYDDDSVEIESTRSLPAQVPSFAKSFFGDTITVSERQEWEGVDAAGARTGQFTGTFAGAPVSLEGELRLMPHEGGTAFVMATTVKASVPLVGGKIEDLVREQVQRAARKEERLGNEWLAERG